MKVAAAALTKGNSVPLASANNDDSNAKYNTFVFVARELLPSKYSIALCVRSLARARIVSGAGFCFREQPVP